MTYDKQNDEIKWPPDKCKDAIQRCAVITYCIDIGMIPVHVFIFGCIYIWLFMYLYLVVSIIGGSCIYIWLYLYLAVHVFIFGCIHIWLFMYLYLVVSILAVRVSIFGCIYIWLFLYLYLVVSIFGCSCIYIWLYLFIQMMPSTKYQQLASTSVSSPTKALNVLSHFPLTFMTLNNVLCLQTIIQCPLNNINKYII